MLVRMVSGGEKINVSIDLTFWLVVLVLISWQFNILWKRHKAITTFVEDRKDYQHLLIRPVGVESPVHEICVAILENLDNKRFRFSRGESKIVYSQVASYYNTPTLVYDTAKNVSISFTDKYCLISGDHFMKELSVNGVVVTLSGEEARYGAEVWTYVTQHLQSKKDKLAKLKEQRHRRAITKLYSEDNQ